MKKNVSFGVLIVGQYVIVALCCVLETFCKTVKRVTEHMFSILGTSLTLGISLVSLDRLASHRIASGPGASDNVCLKRTHSHPAGCPLCAVSISALRIFFILSVARITGIPQVLGCFSLFWFLNLSGSLEMLVHSPPTHTHFLFSKLKFRLAFWNGW